MFQPDDAHSFNLTVYDISDASTLVSEEVGETTDESTAAVDTTEQASEVSTEQGECLKTFL